MGLHLAQRYLRNKEDARATMLRVCVVKVNEGMENDAFLALLEA